MEENQNGMLGFTETQIPLVGVVLGTCSANSPSNCHERGYPPPLALLFVCLRKAIVYGLKSRTVKKLLTSPQSSEESRYLLLVSLKMRKGI